MAQPYGYGPQPQDPSPALTCPKCKASAQPAPEPQNCASCGTPFLLLPGAALDGGVVPPTPDPRAKDVKVKSAATFTYRLGYVTAQGVSEGMADPITGLIPIDQSGVAYYDIYTIAVWRKIDWVALVLTVLVLVPLTGLLIAAAIGEPGFWVAALPFLLLTAWSFYLAVGLRKHFARIAGRWRTIEVRFDRPLWRRRRFYEELLKRSGHGCPPIP